MCYARLWLAANQTPNPLPHRPALDTLPLIISRSSARTTRCGPHNTSGASDGGGFVIEGFAVADDKRDAPRPFDVRTVEYLLKLMTDHDLAEVDLKEGDQRIRLRKGSALLAAPVTYAPAPTAHASVAPPQALHNPGTPASATVSPPPAPAKNYVEIKSPMVGTFYSKSDPKKPDFVVIGAKVSPKTVVCTIEAMKLYNDVVADCTGTVVEICVKSGDFVEFNTVLFRVDPS